MNVMRKWESDEEGLLFFEVAICNLKQIRKVGKLHLPTVCTVRRGQDKNFAHPTYKDLIKR
jgi:hypothetical protein